MSKSLFTTPHFYAVVKDVVVKLAKFEKISK
jgi:hypothetical protein